MNYCSKIIDILIHNSPLITMRLLKIRNSAKWNCKAKLLGLQTMVRGSKNLIVKGFSLFCMTGTQSPPGYRLCGNSTVIWFIIFTIFLIAFRFFSVNSPTNGIPLKLEILSARICLTPDAANKSSII